SDPMTAGVRVSVSVSVPLAIESFGLLVSPVSSAYVPRAVNEPSAPTTMRLRSSFLIVLDDIGLLVDVPGKTEGRLQALELVLRSSRAGDDHADDERARAAGRQVGAGRRCRAVGAHGGELDLLAVVLLDVEL